MKKMRALESLISVVVAVHNDERYLPYCIAGLLPCAIYEIVFVLDRCTDKSKAIILSTHFPFKIKVLELEKKRWKSPTAEPAALGCRAATGNVIYIVNADMYVDPRIFRIDWTNYDVCSFKFLSYGLFDKGTLISTFITRLRWLILANYEKLKTKMVHLRFGTGLYAFRKTVYSHVPHIDCAAEDSYFLNTTMKKGYRYKYFNWSKSLHLRPDNPRSLKFRAVIAAREYHVNLTKAVWYTLKYLNPNYLREYLLARQV
jgi:glycosyltransferase involved in cell wall biosynthesis